MREKLAAISVSDEQIRARIVNEYEGQGIAWCPHTATGFEVYRDLPAAERNGKHWVIAATAHAAKFNEIVEPLVDASVPVPPELEQLLNWPVQFDTIDADSSEVIARL